MSVGSVPLSIKDPLKPNLIEGEHKFLKPSWKYSRGITNTSKEEAALRTQSY